MLTSASQAIASTYNYGAYGASGSAATPFGYTGAEFNPTDQLVYLRNRFYSPQLQRFISEDPSGLAGGVNTYAYAEGDPIDFDDPFGLRPLTDCEKEVLGPYIGKWDLDHADLHDGEVPWWLGKDYIGITMGNDIYFRPGEYDPSTPAGIALLGHELVHVDQYRAGMTYLKYAMSTRHGYENSPYEKSAYAEQREILKDLTEEHSAACTCTK
jgi:RHS repeat-associated protein